jgi:hypothetical protein
VTRSLSAAASTGIRDLLVGPTRPVRVLAAFPAAVYLTHAEGTVAVVAADGVHHPNALVVPAPTAERPLATFRVHQRGHLGAGGLRVAGREVRITRWFDPVPRLPAHTGPAGHLAVAARVAAARRHLVAATGPVPETLTAGATAVADALAAGDADAAEAAARRSVGLGPGLTPAGDDVLAGLLAAALAFDRAFHGAAGSALTDVTRTAGDAIARHATDATTAVSAALLVHAARGEVAAPAGAVLRALAGRGDRRRALDRLLAVGSTSGRDLSVGILAGTALALAHASTSAPPARSAPARRTDHLAAPDPRTT